jgi:serine/threonine protein kinase
MRKSPEIFQTAFTTYTAHKLVDQGGSGRVFEATDSNGEVVAIKALHTTHLTNERIGRFKNEIHFCLKRPHSNIVSILDYGLKRVDGKDCPFYVMPFYPHNLRTLIREGIEPTKVLPYFSQILNGVEAAHLFHVWHRDLKPENILIDSDLSTAIIADFGIARFIKEDLYTLVETRPTTRLANFRYSAPEQRKRGAPVDHRSDIFALGLILNEMFTSEVIHGTSFKRIADVSPEVSYLDEIVDEMLRQNPEERPTSIDSIKQALIARENEFISRQRLNELKNTVIATITTDNPIVNDPIRIISVDYDRGDLVFKLNKEPNIGWEHTFQGMKEVPFLTTGQGPESVRFWGGNALVELDSSSEAQRVTDLFKTYVETANREYAEHVEDLERREEETLRTKLKKQLEEAERRQEILRSVRL